MCTIGAYPTRASGTHDRGGCVIEILLGGKVRNEQADPNNEIEKNVWRVARLFINACGSSVRRLHPLSVFLTV